MAFPELIDHEVSSLDTADTSFVVDMPTPGHIKHGDTLFTFMSLSAADGTWSDASEPDGEPWVHFPSEGSGYGNSVSRQGTTARLFGSVRSVDAIDDSDFPDPIPFDATYTWTWSTDTATGAAIVVRVPRVGGYWCTGIRTPTHTGFAATSAPNLGSITGVGSADQLYIVAAACNQVVATSSLPSGYTLLAEHNSAGETITVAYKQSTSSSDDPGAWTFDTSADYSLLGFSILAATDGEVTDPIDGLGYWG